MNDGHILLCITSVPLAPSIYPGILNLYPLDLWPSILQFSIPLTTVLLSSYGIWPSILWSFCALFPNWAFDYLQDIRPSVLSVTLVPYSYIPWYFDPLSLGPLALYTLFSDPLTSPTTTFGPIFFGPFALFVP